MYIYFFTDDDVQVTYLIEVPEQCTQCTLWKKLLLIGGFTMVYVDASSGS